MKKIFGKYRVGILLHGNKIWISELVSIFFTLLIFTSMAVLYLIIIRNEFIIHNFTKEIELLNRKSVDLEYILEEYQDRLRISELLCSFLGSKITRDTRLTLTDIVYTNSKQFGYDPILLLAVINVESVFNTKAQGKYRSGDLSGAMGLMQLKLETAQEMANKFKMGVLQPDDLFKPEINIVLGVAYLTRLISTFKSFKLGLLAYNQGPGTILSTLSKKEPLSINYYKKVLDSYYKLQQLSTRNSARNEPNQSCW